MSVTTLQTSVVDVFVYPSSFFNSLIKSTNWLWLGLALLLLPAALSSYVFVDNMSMEWFVQQSLAQSAEMTRSEYENAKQYITSSFAAAGKVTAIFVSIAMLIPVLLVALYFKLVCFTHDHFKYKDWLNFSVWISMPQLVNTLGFCLLLLLADNGDLPLNLVNYSSLNQLLLNLNMDNPYFQLAENLNVFYLWSIALGSIGLQRWCNYSVTKALVISSAPYLLLFSIWALAI